MAKTNTFEGPYQHDIGQGNSATVSNKLIVLQAGSTPPYLVPSTGYATTPDTPDMSLVGQDVRWSAKLRLNNASAASQGIINKRPSSGSTAEYTIRTNSKTLLVLPSFNGAFATTTHIGTITGAVSGGDFYMRGRLQLNDGTGWKVSGEESVNGVTWKPLSGIQQGTPPPTGLFDGANAVWIGARPGPSDVLQGRIYWAQMERLDPDGTPVEVIYRFDAEEYPGTGTTYVDPRGRTWTLSAANAIKARVESEQIDSGEIVRAQALNGSYVYFKAGGGVVTQALMDALLGPEAFPGWPPVAGYTLVYEPEWWPIEHGEMPAFQVKRVSYGSSIGGDYVRGSSDPAVDAAIQNLPNAVLKYQTSDEEHRSAVVGQALLYVQPAGYHSVRIEWDWPPDGGLGQGWTEVALVRSMFGAPTTPNDGVTLFRDHRTQWTDTAGELMVGPVIYDDKLSGGFWYYYTLFFNISPQAPVLGDWVSGYSDAAQVPNHYQHDEHLFSGVPPYYQWIDENNRRKDGQGFLKQFLSIFGFELDFTRQSIEFMQDMYHTDISPIPLLRQLGQNIGAVEEQGLGDIRFRAMMSDLAQRINIRGTQKGLQQTIETMSKYDTEVTVGTNMMMLPDDSAPFFSTGNWAGPHPDLVPSLGALPGPVVAWEDVLMEVLPPDEEIPGVGALGFIRFSSEALADLFVTCGCGWVDPPVLSLPENTINQPGEYIPLTNGIPVTETGVYGFTAYLRGSVAAQEPKLAMLWFSEIGRPSSLISAVFGTPPPGGTTVGWDAKHVVQGVAPANAVYLVPAILTTARPAADAYVDMTAAMVYLIQEPGLGISVTPPDQLLTLGDPNEKIGDPNAADAPDDFVGWVIGAPVQRNAAVLPPATLMEETEPEE